MEQLLELLQQIQELAGAGAEAVAQALQAEGGGGAAPEGPPEGGPEGEVPPEPPA